MAKDKSKSTESHFGGKGHKSALDRSPSHLLHRVLQIALDIYAEETGSGAPTQRQFAVLTAVAANEGLTQTDLVQATGIDRSTLADMVARMISKGLLDRARSATDARANTVSLTEAGREQLDAALPRVEKADERILSLLSSAKRDSFLKLLADMAKAGEALREAEDQDAGLEKKKKKKAKAEKPEKGLKSKEKKDKKPKKDKAAKKAEADKVLEPAE